MTLVAFHNKPSIKAEYIARVRKHRLADELVRGTGWASNGRGCAVGCTLQSYDHTRYPVELGIPEWIAHLEDRLFEKMSFVRHQMWPERFLATIPVGADLEAVKPRFLIWVLADARSRVAPESEQVLAAIDGVIALWSRADIGSINWMEEKKKAALAAKAAAMAKKKPSAAAATAAAGMAMAAASAASAAAAAKVAMENAAAVAGAAAMDGAAARVARTAFYDRCGSALLVMLDEAEELNNDRLPRVHGVNHIAVARRCVAS